MAYNYSNEVLSCLKRAGWEFRREINTEPFIQRMKEDNFPVIPEAIKFLSKYGNLTINFVNKRSGINDDITFDPSKAMDIVVSEKLEDFVPRIKRKQLCAIGTAYREHFVLMMDEKANVYGAYDDFLVRIADTGEKAIEAIILDYDFEEIP